MDLPRSPPPPFDIENLQRIEPPWQAIKDWIPTTNPTSIGSSLPESFKKRGLLTRMSMCRAMVIPTQMATTQAKYGTQPKSIWKAAASWFSITPDKQDAHN